MKTGKIIKVSGPLVVAEGMDEANVYDVVKVGEKGLIGEIIEMRGDKASIQVYEETSGIGPGDPVITTGEPLSVELGPGLIESMFDGIQRPLDAFMKAANSAFLSKGVEVKSLNREKKWPFVPTAKVGDKVSAGDVIGTVQETAVVLHRIMVPFGVEGTIKEIKAGDFNVEEVIVVVETEKGDKNLTLMQKWPVRKGRPYARKLNPVEPMTTGQRVIDTFFPVAKGGAAAVPGPFGAGKTVVQHQVAKWGDTEIVVYVGCGERGNEMTDVLNEFPELKDPKTGESLMKRTVLIANTSNMPVAAREASIYTGITIAEYFRDMGYSVSIMADSTSRWAEALREMSGRLEEMPGDEGYPAYLEEIVRLVGMDALSEGDRLKLEVAKSIREDYLQQNAFHENDTYTSLNKQYKMLNLILSFKHEAEKALEAGVYLDKVLKLPVRDRIARSKYISEEEISKMDDILVELKSEMNKLISEGGVLNA